MEKNETSVYFCNKTDMLENIKNIYECLLDIGTEVETMILELKQIKKNVSHLRNIILKDLVITDGTPKSVLLNKISLTNKEWSEYVNKSSSDDDDKKK